MQHLCSIFELGWITLSMLQLCIKNKAQINSNKGQIDELTANKANLEFYVIFKKYD